MFFNEYPYRNLTDLNLDFLLKAIGEMQNEVKNFVTLNAVKYANPIQWDITRQYEKNTIVIDPQSGTAYISVAPVPVGIALTNTDFWSVVFDLERFVNMANNNFTSRVEAQTTLNATFPTNQGELLIWGGELYVALSNIIAGDQYVVDSNIKRITMEEITGDLNDLLTLDKSSLVAAINENLSKIDNEIAARINADNTMRTDIDNEVIARSNADITLQTNIDNEVIARTNAIANIASVLKLYNTYADVIADIANLVEGDIVTTKGYNSIGDGGNGMYEIHDNSQPYYIACGSKYAELKYSNEINFDALGAIHDIITTSNANDNAIDVAIRLAYHNSPPTNLTAGYMTGGTTIKFGPHFYRFNRPISAITNNFHSITFEGCDQNTTIASDINTFWLTASVGLDAFNNNIVFRNLVFQGSAPMINIDKLTFSKFEHCLFLNQSVGVFLTSAVGIDFYECIFTNCSVGCVISTNSTTVNFVSCAFRFCDIGLQLLTNDNGIITEDCIFEYNTSYGLYVETCDNFSAKDLWIEGNKCLMNNSDIFGRNIKTFVGTNSVQSTVNISTTVAHNLDIECVNHDVVIDNSNNLFTGYVRYKGANPLVIE